MMRRLWKRRQGTSTTAQRAELVVRALIGREQHVLLVYNRAAAHWSLPGGQVRPGELVETALRRELCERLDITASKLSFAALVENRYTDQSGVGHHEINVVFDVILPAFDRTSEMGSSHCHWFGWAELGAVDLRPVELRNGLADGRFTDEPWAPSDATRDR